ncbi:MAG: SIR2 family protein [Candidatus Atabeyarchaeum deiterrae]
MLFVGAGISKVFGVETMLGLYKAVKARLEKEGLDHALELIDSVERQLVRSGYEQREVDIETVFSVLNGLLRPQRALKEAGPFASYVAASLAETPAMPSGTPVKETPISKLLPQADPEIEDAIEWAKKVISEECNKVNADKAGETYDKLFAIMPFGQSIDVYANGEKYELKNFAIATTNYDLAIERYFESKGKHLTDGFSLNEAQRQPIFTPHGIIGGVRIQLIKLHGSIDRFIFEDGKIVQRREEPSSVSFHGEKVAGKLMVYPMDEKYVSQDPYATYFSALRRELMEGDAHLSIGYSFRDQAINNAFLDAAKLNPKFLLIILNPEARSIPERVRLPAKKCLTIPWRIDEPIAFDTLKILSSPPPQKILT